MHDVIAAAAVNDTTMMSEAAADATPRRAAQGTFDATVEALRYRCRT